MITALIIFLAALIQSAVGFGMALIAMPLLVLVWGIQTAAPSLAVMSLAVMLFNAFRWRRSIMWRDVLALLVPALVAVPVGVWVVSAVDQVLVTRLLGVLIIAYALYSLAGLRVPSVTRPGWAVGAGAFSGLLAGAYNTGGPPLVAYASATGWTPEQFKGNLQTIFFALGLMVVTSHAVAGNFTNEVWLIVLYGLPGIVLGTAAGLFLGRRIRPDLFRKLVLVLLIVLGVQLLI